MKDSVQIGILGDFNPKLRTHVAIGEALEHAAARLERRVEPRWIATPSVTAEAAEDLLSPFHGFWAAPASPYQSFEGMLRGIELARRRDWPFVGT